MRSGTGDPHDRYTTIRFDWGDDTARVASHSPSVIEQVRLVVAEHPYQSLVTTDAGGAIRCTIPVSQLRHEPCRVKDWKRAHGHRNVGDDGFGDAVGAWVNSVERVAREDWTTKYRTNDAWWWWHVQTTDPDTISVLLELEEAHPRHVTVRPALNLHRDLMAEARIGKPAVMLVP